LSSAEAQRFADIATDVTNAVRQKGKFDNKTLEMELDAAEMTVNSEAIRWLVGKQVHITSKGDVYGRKWDSESYDAVLLKELEKEYHNNLILLAIKAGFTSVREISKKTNLDLLRISYLLADLERTSRVEFLEMNNSIPAFGVL